MPVAVLTAARRVLVVEDDGILRMLIGEVLALLGYHMVEAGDAAAALALLRSDPGLDLLITDIGLPGGMDGRRMADLARQARPLLQVLFVTGYAGAQAPGHGPLPQGMQVLVKPFAMEALVAMLRAMTLEMLRSPEA